MGELPAFVRQILAEMGIDPADVEVEVQHQPLDPLDPQDLWVLMRMMAPWN